MAVSNKTAKRTTPVPPKTKTVKKMVQLKDTKKSEFVSLFLQILNTVKLFHWKTMKYAQHKASDEFYDSLSKNVDLFVETMMGKKDGQMKEMKVHFDSYENGNPTDFKEKMFQYHDFLVHMDDYLHASRDADLLSIRDNMLTDLNKFLYLFALQ